ncbi:hypothetical protein C5167_045694 [Papaver somniferum]|uniref:UVR domain-containing protein n=1 Tax=Papaver somniferum TaxID=3469 RepID=A0A4Y7LBM5_PAPSO|nr:uncharacterized protein LOC113322682 [Papaver somniferum]RZC82904.1 hypothetical protein C5167_045694 [Papaver somniferum]
MAVPNISAISLKSRLSSSLLQLPAVHRPCTCKSNSYNVSSVKGSVPVLRRSLLGQVSAEFGGSMPRCQVSRSNSWKPCRVKGEDLEGTLSSETILDEQALEKELQTAIEQENYAKAAKIRDSLRFLHEDGKASVLAANARFYNSFRQGDLSAMQALWVKADHVCCVHPGVSGISGYDLVMGSWEFVWAEYEFPLEIEVKNVQVHVRGDVGYVTCLEIVKTKGSSWGKQFATNVFEKIDGQWFMCIHHASYIDL